MAIGETILGAVLQVVFDRLASQEVLNFFRKSKIDHTLGDKLITVKFAAEKLLSDVEGNFTTDQNVREWLEQLKHWIYRAEEVVDQISTEALQSSIKRKSPSEPQSLMNKVRNLSFKNSSPFLKTVNLDIKEIVNMLECMLSQKNTMELSEFQVGGAPQRLPTTCLLEDSTVYGRDWERKELLKILLSREAVERKSFNVVAIVGMGGLGKTTLAKMVYNDAKVQEAFELKAWVCVSDHFDISQVTRAIIESVTLESYSSTPNLNVLQIELSGKLRDKKFLLVLDDVWNNRYHDWEVLLAPFCAGATGSKIIVTTRNKEVAFAMRSKQVFCPQPLSSEDAWSLFFRHAFEGRNMMFDPCLDCIGRKIVQKCQGLPLAVKTLGGLLYNIHDCKDWEAILHSSLWNLTVDHNNVIPALWLSYYHLPPHLKRCFSYCAIFPKDHKIDRKKLVFLWMAEGFILQIDSKVSIERLGEDYLLQLISRSFVEEMDDSYIMMHDLMHDLAQSVSGNFLARHEHEQASIISERVRHFSYVASHCDIITKFQDVNRTKYLRSFLRLESVWPTSSYLSNKVSTVLKPSLSCLRVLSLSRYENLKVPELLECPKQLRYLDVSHTTINQLPQWVSSLCHLQTLMLSKCKNLNKLPIDTCKLVSLRHLDIRGSTLISHMPEQMSKLSSLRTLSDYIVGKNTTSGIEELRELQHLYGKIAIRQLQNITDPSHAHYVNLKSRNLIDELELEFNSKGNDDSEKDRKVLDGLQPPLDVERLTIRYYGDTTFPQWLSLRCADFRKMTLLRLINCCYCNTLPPLGQLLSLKRLEIEGMEFIQEVGHEFHGHNSRCSFPSLESLSFKRMQGWKKWLNPSADNGLLWFPRLMKLSLQVCPKLKGDLPAQIPSLKEVVIYDCEELEGLASQVSSIRSLDVDTCPRVKLTTAFDMASINTLKLVRLVQLVSLPPQIVMLSSLHVLEIQWCHNLKFLANVELPSTLKSLTIGHCKVLESLPRGMEFLACLRWLSISFCLLLRGNPGNYLPTSLTRLFILHCPSCELAMLMKRMQDYTSLEELSLEGLGRHLESFPLEVFPNLCYLHILSCKGLEKVYISEGMNDNNLKSLSYLRLSDCPKLEMVGKEIRRGEATILPIPNLTQFYIENCKKVKPTIIEMDGEVLLPKLTKLEISKSSTIRGESDLSLRRNLARFSCLTWLEIDGEEVECFPMCEGWDSLPISLTNLWIRDFPRLRRVDGKALQTLTSLQYLWIWECPKLEMLPEAGLPPSLGYLDIKGCPKVEERCMLRQGLDWSKVHHIPCVFINNRCITGCD